jgi:two-component system sensor histidine kinase KdpD
MNDDTKKLNPDQWLELIKNQEPAEIKGRLKMFFGMCAGVGKTYAMLESALTLQKRGINVLVGYVETHGRVETEALLKDLKVLPRLKITYKERVFDDFDIDAILSLKPQVVVVDELAHSNIPGMRHAKRYQDVLELLDNGISVLTTLNVQHLESQKDVINQITGITIHETVPDVVIDRADDIELVDLSPQDLLIRLSEGKVYIAENAKRAVVNFFTTTNLTALREIALRTAAERVDNQLTKDMHLKGAEGPWRTGERLMVAVGPSPYSEKLIRWTRRIASSMNAPWLAVNVQKLIPGSTSENALLTKNISLAQELGAELVTVTDEDIAKALIRVARLRNVTQIVVGKSMNHPVSDLLKGGSLVDKLIKMSGDIDIYVVQGYKSPQFPGKDYKINFSSPQHYWIASGVTAFVALICFLAGNIIDYRSVGMFLLFTVLVLAGFVSRGPVLLAAALGAFMWNFFFIPPRYTFTIAHLTDAMMLAMYFLIAIIGGGLTSRIKRHELSIQQKEQDTSYLNSFLSKLTTAHSTDFLVRIASAELTARFKASSAIFLSGIEGKLSPVIHKESSLQIMDEKDQAVAQWVFNNSKPAGYGTTTLSLSEYSFFPLNGTQGVIGVTGLKFLTKEPLSQKDKGLLLTILQQFAISLEREHYRIEAEKSILLSKSEDLYKTLLGSVSHQLRTPLVVIKGASTELLNKDTGSDECKRTILASDINNAADQLDRLVKSLLDITRIESGILNFRPNWCDFREIIDVVLNEIHPLSSNHRIITEVDPELPLFKGDEALLRQAIFNIVHNALLHTPAESKIWIKAGKTHDKIDVSIEDNGPGISSDDLPNIFQKFYRSPDVKGHGIGLGLSIARGFIEANNGTIQAENRIEGGARFKIIFPLSDNNTSKV